MQEAEPAARQPGIEALGALPGARRFTLETRLGETVVEGEAALGWVWPER